MTDRLRTAIGDGGALLLAGIGTAVIWMWRTRWRAGDDRLADVGDE